MVVYPHFPLVKRERHNSYIYTLCQSTDERSDGTLESFFESNCLVGSAPLQHPFSWPIVRKLFIVSSQNGEKLVS